uniref:CUE domain-containing protein n=1 Tax=Arundo donax TaxID=35708 RepID=A0A0A9FRQ5_ARUDO
MLRVLQRAWNLRLRSVLAMGSKFIEKALEECGNDLDSAINCMHNRHVQSAECDVAHVYQSPVGMSTEGEMPAEGILDGNEVAAPVQSIPGAESLPSSNTEWVEILVNEMVSASDTDDAKARASRVLEVFERSLTSRIGAEALQSFRKENSVYKEQFEAVIRENTILKKAVAIQHERQKEHDERNQELQQLKQLVAQYQEQVRSLEVNNYALSMHLRQAQQGSSMPGHFHRDIF